MTCNLFKDRRSEYRLPGLIDALRTPFLIGRLEASTAGSYLKEQHKVILTILEYVADKK